jgi:hypothetical protein
MGAEDKAVGTHQAVDGSVFFGVDYGRSTVKYR